MSNFYVRKDASGVYRWVGSFTNSFVDLDEEIITSEAHKEKAAALASGAFPMPTLWLCHEPSWKIGQTDLFMVDEVAPGVVFVVVSGVFDEGMEKVAKGLSGVEASMSHGLYVLASGKFNGKKTIEKYRSVEISVLPKGLALPANPLTYYVVEEGMSIVDSITRGKLAALLGVDTVDAIEEANKGIATKALDDNVLYKATDGVESEAEVEVKEVTAEVEPTEAPVAENDMAEVEPTEYVTVGAMNDFAALIGEALKSFREEAQVANQELAERIEKALADQTASAGELKKELARVQQERDTPAAARPAYTALLMGIMGDKTRPSGVESKSVEEAPATRRAIASGPIGYILDVTEE